MVRRVKARSGYEYTRSYTDLKGVELGGSGSNIDAGRLAVLENMYRDYEGEGGGLIESVPGYRRLVDLGEAISKIYLHKGREGDYLVIRAGDSLYHLPATAKEGDYDNPLPLMTLTGEGCAFTISGDLYVSGNEGIFKIDGEGNVSDATLDAYTPTTHLNGEALEQRNMLSDYAIERHVFSDAMMHGYQHPALKFRILDDEICTCSVIGTYFYPSGVLNIPTYANIGGKKYRVIEIERRAFSLCEDVEEIYVGDGVLRIGNLAFEYCKGVRRIVLPDSLVSLGVGVFADCHSLKDLYLGMGLNTVEGEQFARVPTDMVIHYPATSTNFEEIANHEAFHDYEIVYNSYTRARAVELPITNDVIEVGSVRANGRDTAFEVVRKNERITGVVVVGEDFHESDSTVDIRVLLAEHYADFGAGGVPISAKELIKGMTKSEIFDGRVFLAGNKSMPNTIIYSGRQSDTVGGLYFGIENYMNDGIGSYPITELLAVRDSLAVFKAGDDGGGSIYYHSPKTTGDAYIPKIYPREYVHSGIGVIGPAENFLDDPVFLTTSGLMALGMKAINYERSVEARSHNVNFDLLKQDLSTASMTEWQGYLVIGVGERAYLADSRQVYRHECGSLEYEWFTMSGVGGYKNSTRVYRYDSYETGEYKIHAREGEVVPGEVWSVGDEDGMIWYTVEDGVKYTVYPTREYRGGDFCPASVYIGVGGLLFFGTTGGGLYVFNSDMRGVAPKHLSLMPDFDPIEYKEHMGRVIHPYFYSFDSHAPKYKMATASDDCGIPHLTKSTIKHSLVVKYHTFAKSVVTVEVLTDSSTYKELSVIPAVDFSFVDLSFEDMTLSPLEYGTVPIREKEKNWVEKQLSFYSDGFESPIGIYSIVYRYMVRGRIKKE